MKIALYRWLKANSVILCNAGSLVGTSVVTSVVGFAYWWLAARVFTPEAVGFASATISAMILLGTVGVVGLGTLLMGELPRQPGKEISLINAALIVVGGVGGCAGILFALAAPYISKDFEALGANLENILLFAVGVGLTAITLVFDQALIGLLRGGLQLWRNALFAVAKLLVLFIVGAWLSDTTGLAIYVTWAIGNALSLITIVGVALLKNGLPRVLQPQWRLLRKLGRAALKHHAFNLTLLAPTLIQPVLVTVLLSAKVTAWFYVAWTIAGSLFVIPAALTTVLYAISSGQPGMLARKVRLTLGIALVTGILANALLFFSSKQVLGFFGESYAEQAAWCLRFLSLGAFPVIIKHHYIAICRIKDHILLATIFMLIGGVFELSGITLGAHFAGLTGLSVGWLIVVCVEALFMFRTVLQAARSGDASTDTDLQRSAYATDTRVIRAR